MVCTQQPSFRCYDRGMVLAGGMGLSGYNDIPLSDGSQTPFLEIDYGCYCSGLHSADRSGTHRTFPAPNGCSSWVTPTWSRHYIYLFY